MEPEYTIIWALRQDTSMRLCYNHRSLVWDRGYWEVWADGQLLVQTEEETEAVLALVKDDGI